MPKIESRSRICRGTPASPRRPDSDTPPRSSLVILLRRGDFARLRVWWFPISCRVLESNDDQRFCERRESPRR